MKAACVHRFGPPDVIRVEDLPMPVPGAGEVVVRVTAAGVGPWDAWVRAGKSVLDQPLPLILGSDLSGTVTAAGAGVRGFEVGQEVFGVTNPRFTGAYAEYALASTAMIAPRPPGLDARDAAALPVVAVTAMQMIDEARVTAGQRVLVQGAGGSVGSLAVQMLVDRGAQVVGADVPGAAGFVKTLGDIAFVDATAPGFEQQVGAVDAVLDTVGGPSQVALLAALRPGGALVSSVSPPPAAETERRGVRGVFFVVRVTTAALVEVGRLAAARKITWRLAPIMPLAQARRAHEMLEGTVPRPPGKILFLP